MTCVGGRDPWARHSGGQRIICWGTGLGSLCRLLSLSLTTIHQDMCQYPILKLRKIIFFEA